MRAGDRISAPGRNAFIDSLRGISIGLVLLHHFNIAYTLRGTPIADVIGWTALHAVVRNGNYGVTMFFVISGFLITSNARRRFGHLADIRPWAFYSMRAARILPCVTLVVAVVNFLAFWHIPIFLNHTHTGGEVPFWLGDLAAFGFWMNVLMAHAGWFNYVLCVLWSLSVEEVFYVGFPVLCRLLRRERYLVAAWLVFIAVGPIWRAWHQNDENEYLFAYLACFDGIAFGCCAAVLQPRLRLNRAVAMGIYIPAVMIAVWVYLWRPIGVTNVYGVTLMAAATAAMIVTHRSSAVHRFPVIDRVSHGVCWSGRISYELYLFHLVVLAGLRSLWPPDVVSSDGKMAILLAYLVLSAGIGAVISRYYSDSLNRTLRRPHVVV